MQVPPRIDTLILIIRSERVILGADLATIHGMEPRRLNEQVRRNASRFPGDFAFQLTAEEFRALLDRDLVRPDAFTEHGASCRQCPSQPGSDRHECLCRPCLRPITRSPCRQRRRTAGSGRNRQILVEHDEALKIIWHKLQPLLHPSPDPPRRLIGFNR